MKTVMIVTGESSGELYGSLLAKALRAKQPDIRIIGVGGERMRDAGVELISGIASAFGLIEAIASFQAVKQTFRKTLDAIDRLLPEVIVLIDYPDFNIRVAEYARKKGIKVLYYVSPQVWAWRKKRAKKIAAISDRIAVILPFEESIYKELGAHCEFVGHPALEEIEYITKTLIPAEGGKTVLKKSLGLKPERPVLALLPGSRPHELKELLPLMLDVVRAFKSEFSKRNLQFVMPLAPNIDVKKYENLLSELRSEGVLIKKENAIKMLYVSDMAVIASGTAALQAAFLEIPLVVVYRLFPLSYLIGRLMINVKYISLINLIPDQQVVKELIQMQAKKENVIYELKKIMLDDNYRDSMIEHFRTVRGIFSGKNPSQRVADMIIEMKK